MRKSTKNAESEKNPFCVFFLERNRKKSKKARKRVGKTSFCRKKPEKNKNKEKEQKKMKGMKL